MNYKVKYGKYIGNLAMQRMIQIAKRIVIFLGLLAVTVGFTVSIIFALLKYFDISSLLKSFDLSETELHTLFYNNSVASFILVYVSGYKFLKKCDNRFKKFGIYGILYIIFFLCLTVLILSII